MARDVLLVADEAAAALIPAGHRVRTVPVRRVLEEARTRPPGIVYLGAVPGAARLCTDLKLDPETNPLPVVRVIRPGNRPPTLEVEADAFLTESAGRPEVAGAIRRALEVRSEAESEGSRGDVRWRLPSGQDELEAFAEQFAHWLAGSGLSSFGRQQMGMAVRELAANAIEWGHRGQRERLVLVSARLDDEKVSVLVRDSGPGFNPRDLPHAARPGDPVTHMLVRADKQMREGGFGILMASGLVDQLAYNDAGNEALAIKYLRRRPALVAS